MTTLYRYESITLHRADSFFPDVSIYLCEFTIDKETSNGYWIRSKDDIITPLHKKWMSKKSRRRYAFTTKAEAIQSFMARKRKQIKIVRGQLEMAKIALRLAAEELLKIEEYEDSPTTGQQ